ncbi:hypothetical protein CSAL01_05242 [Colletotrichum salicis]|uniref:Uncharacterized protein n=1 Tax=Colletotrichum salicis TaxID=1209931 RepID=A0A135ULZ5_9PEZI|nr:hypothetical protein CSAL01_05242 [Colletotrichum salicis]
MEVMKEKLVVDPVTEVTSFVVETSVGEVGDEICDGEESEVGNDANIESLDKLLVASAVFEVDAGLVDDSMFAGSVAVNDEVGLVGRSEDVPLEVDVKAVVESEEAKVTNVLALDTSCDPGVEPLLDVGISADEREVVGRSEVSERKLVDDRELVNDTELTDETGLLEDKDEVNKVVPVEFEVVGYVEELERLIERTVVEIEVLDSSVIEEVKIVELELGEEDEEDSEFVETIKVDKVFEIVVPVADVEDVSESEEVMELVVFVNGPPVDVEEGCVLVTPRLVIVDDEDAIDSEEVEEDVVIEVDDEFSNEVDEPESEAEEEVEVIEKLDKDDDEEEVDDEVNNEVEEIGAEVKDKVEDVSVVDSEAEEEVEEEVKVVEDDFDKKVKDEVSVLDSELDDVVDDVLDSDDSVVVGAGGTSRKP